MNFRRTYAYCDVHSHKLRQWKRVKIDEVEEKLVKPSNKYRCFQSVQRYEHSRREKGEKFWMPLFFDLDSKDPAEALADVKRLVCYLDEHLNVSPEFARVYFSGKKGFHVVVEPEILDIRPDVDLHLRVRKLALRIAETLNLKTFDVKVYSERRVLRVPNSVHEGTRLFKIELYHQELNNGIEWILEQAKRPKDPCWPADVADEIGVVEEAKALWDDVSTEFDEARELERLKPDRVIHDFGDYPVCVKHILALSEQPRPSSGNRTVLSVASYMKDCGKSEDEAISVLVPWAKRQTNIGDAGNPEACEAMVRSTVKYVYRSDGPTYHFACKYILSLGTSENKIPCQGIQCPAIRGKMQETKEIIDLELGEFSRSTYLGEKVRVPCLVSGKAGTPYVVPRRVRFVCHPDEEKGFCGGCPIAAFNGEASFEFSVSDPEILEIVNCTNAQQWEAMRRKWGFPKGCRRATGRVEENMNVEEVRMSPAAVDIWDFDRREFVARKGFFVGYPMQTNKRFRLEGYPVKEPRTQSSAFLFETAKKLETEVETFRMSPEVLEELCVFRAAEGQSVEEKFREIHDDLAHNVYRIWDRMETAWAMDLVAHSVRGFKFRKEPFVKGWAELLVVGDSGQGKTAIARRLLQGHYRIGEYISGGSSKRTGLLYSYQENGKTWMLVWGAIPLNDGGLVIIDEFGDLPEDQFALLTDVRSSGVVKAVGVVTAETFGRVRLLALSNPRKGKHLAEFDYPCSSVKELVPAAEDIRRFDFACSVASGEVSVEVINAEERPEIPHVYTSHLCSQLIRWAWSRTEREVQFTEDAGKLILTEATRMAYDFFAGELPLVEPADQRFKIARLAAAIAARVFSTDDSGEILVVGVDHVLFATTLLYNLYTSPNFRYHEWSKGQRRTEDTGVSDLELAFAEIRKIKDWRKAVALLQMPGQVEMRDLEGAFGNRAQASSVANVLRHLGLVERKWGKFFRTAKGNALVKWAKDQGKITKEDIESAIFSETQGQQTF